MSGQTLDHADPDCTGEWEQVGQRGVGHWRCSVCGRTHPSTPDNDRAADREYGLGVLLRSQARQARLRYLLPPPRPPMRIEFPELEGGDDAEAGE